MIKSNGTIEFKQLVQSVTIINVMLRHWQEFVSSNSKMDNSQDH